MSPERLRVAVVGLGKMGLLHASILNILPDVQLKALCDKSGMIRRFMKKMLNNMHIVDDVEKLSDMDLDVVYVTTPIRSHYPILKIIYLEEISRNLFVEKTLASSYEEARELCEFAGRCGKANMVGYTRRFAVTFNKAKTLLDQEAIGEVSSFKAHAYSSDFVGTKTNPTTRASRGGVLQDLGCHAIDTALWFFGDFQVDQANATPLVDDGLDDSVFFRVREPNGIEGEFSISWCMRKYRLPEIGLSISGSKGIMNVNDDKLELRRNRRSSIWHRHDLHDDVFFWLGGPEYYREDAYFINSVVQRRDAEPSFETASKVDQIIDEVKGANEQ